MKTEYFIDFFVCPNCKSPMVEKEKLICYQIRENPNFCKNCGKEIATALAEAVAMTRKD